MNCSDIYKQIFPESNAHQESSGARLNEMDLDKEDISIVMEDASEKLGSVIKIQAVIRGAIVRKRLGFLKS